MPGSPSPRSPASGFEPTLEMTMELLPDAAAATDAASQLLLKGDGLAYPKRAAP